MPRSRHGRRRPTLRRDDRPGRDRRCDGDPGLLRDRLRAGQAVPLVADRLADPEHVSLAVSKPDGPFALAALARVVALDLRDALVFELEPAATEVGDGGLDVVD